MPRSSFPRAPRTRRLAWHQSCCGPAHFAGNLRSELWTAEVFLHCAVSIGAAALVAGCDPDTSERSGAAQGRPGDSALSRNDAGQPPSIANRDTTVRPPTTATNPAAPGSAAAPPPLLPRLMARAEIRPLEDNTARGVVEFQHAAAGSSGPMTIHVTLMGLAAGPHGMHVHTGTDCTMPGDAPEPAECAARSGQRRFRHAPSRRSRQHHGRRVGHGRGDAAGLAARRRFEFDRQSHRRARGPGRSVDAAGRRLG